MVMGWWDEVPFQANQIETIFDSLGKQPAAGGLDQTFGRVLVDLALGRVLLDFMSSATIESPRWSRKLAVKMATNAPSTAPRPASIVYSTD